MLMGLIFTKLLMKILQSGKDSTNKINGGGLVPSTQTIGRLLSTPWPAMLAGKMDFKNS
jgi:hypothetical protein